MRLVLAGVLTAILVGGIVDLVRDAPERWMSQLYELGLILGGSAGAICSGATGSGPRSRPAPAALAGRAQAERDAAERAA
jgi:hypothetical protein